MTTPVFPINDRLEDLSPAAGSTELGYDFELKSEAGLTVMRIRAGVRTTLVNGVDYDFLSGLGTAAGGTITLGTASIADDRYLLIGLEPIARASDLLDSNAFSAKRYNEDGDLGTLLDQEQRRDIDRAIKSDYGQAGLTIDTEAVTEGKVFMRGAGNKVVAGPDAADISAAQGYAAAAGTAATNAGNSATAAAASAAALAFASTKAEMMTLLAAGNVAVLAASLTSITLEAGDWDVFRANAGKVFPRVPTTLNLPAGALEADANQILEFSHLSSLLTLKGATPVETTLTDIASVTGAAHNWTVTINVASSAGIEVSDYVNLYDIGPLPLLMGDKSDASILRARPIAGELFMPVLYAGAITASSGGGSAGFGINTGLHTLTDYLNDGDLVTFKAQSRLLGTVGASSASIVGAWAQAIAGSRAYWLTLPSTGTAGTSGSSTTITLTGGLATDEANQGDVILIDGDTRQIEAINSDTEIVVDEPITVTAGTPFSFLTPGELHWGTHEVTAVGSGTITVKNTSKYKPPVNQVQGGEVIALKTVLKNTGTAAKKDGITFSQNGSIAEIDQVAIVGTKTTDTIGLFVGARVSAGVFGDRTQRNYRASCMLGPRVGIAGWGNPVWVGMSCYLDARRLSVSNALDTSVTVLEAGTLNARQMTITGGVNAALQINGGGTVLCTEILITGHGGDGVRRFGGAVLTSENLNITYCGGMGARTLGGGDFHANEGIIKCCGDAGLRSEGSNAETQRMTIMCCKRDGIEADGLCDVLAMESWISGTSNASGSGHGCEALSARVNLDGAGIKGSQGQDVYCDEQARVSLDGAALAKLTVDDGSTAFIPNVSPIPTITGVLHVGGISKDGSRVTNGVDDYQIYTAGVAATSGTITSYTQIAKFREILGDVNFEADVTITDNGTGSGSLTIGLPFSATGNFPVSGYNLSTGEIVQGYTSGPNIVLLTGAAVYPAATGERIIVVGKYR